MGITTITQEALNRTEVFDLKNEDSALLQLGKCLLGTAVKIVLFVIGVAETVFFVALTVGTSPLLALLSPKKLEILATYASLSAQASGSCIKRIFTPYSHIQPTVLPPSSVPGSAASPVPLQGAPRALKVDMDEYQDEPLHYVAPPMRTVAASAFFAAMLLNIYNLNDPYTCFYNSAATSMVIGGIYAKNPAINNRALADPASLSLYTLGMITSVALTVLPSVLFPSSGFFATTGKISLAAAIVLEGTKGIGPGLAMSGIIFVTSNIGSILRSLMPI